MSPHTLTGKGKKRAHAPDSLLHTYTHTHPHIHSQEKSARTLLAIVIAFTLLNSSVSVGFSYLSRDFWSALNAKDTDAFYPTLGKYAIALAGGTPVAVLYKFYRDKLSVQWRSWMTQRVYIH